MDASKIEQEIGELSGVLSAHNNDDRSDSQEAKLRKLKSKKVVQSISRTKLTYFLEQNRVEVRGFCAGCATSIPRPPDTTL